MILKKNIKKCIPVLLLTATLGIVSTGCGSKGSEQRYAWPLATASPEDTVTQIFAEKFADEVDKLSDGKMKIQVYPNSTLGWKAVQTEIFLLLCRILHRKFLS